MPDVGGGDVRGQMHDSAVAKEGSCLDRRCSRSRFRSPDGATREERCPDTPRPVCAGSSARRSTATLVDTCDTNWSCLSEVAAFLHARLYVPTNATLAQPVNAFLAPAGNEGSTDVMFTRNGRQLTLAARQDDAPFRPSATLPAGAQPLTSTDVEGSTVSVTDDAAYWSYDGWTTCSLPTPAPISPASSTTCPPSTQRDDRLMTDARRAGRLGRRAADDEDIPETTPGSNDQHDRARRDRAG